MSVPHEQSLEKDEQLDKEDLHSESIHVHPIATTAEDLAAFEKWADARGSHEHYKNNSWLSQSDGSLSIHHNLDADLKKDERNHSLTTESQLISAEEEDSTQGNLVTIPRRKSLKKARLSTFAKSFMNLGPSSLKVRQPDPLKLEARSPPVKVTILGSGNSGKSTLLKRIELLCGDSWTESELSLVKETIVINLVNNMRTILRAMVDLEIRLDSYHNQHHAQTVLQQFSAPLYDEFPPELCAAIEALWADAGVQECFCRAKEYQLLDCAAYFFREVRRIASPGYVPTTEDNLRSRVRTTGLHTWSYRYKRIGFEITDTAGEQAERKKWRFALENPDAIIYCVDISAYDLSLYELKDYNRMDDTLALFKTLCDNNTFATTDVILLFTKVDVLATKILESPVEQYFSSFAPRNGRDIEEVKSYFGERFRSLHPHPTKIVATMFTSTLKQDPAAVVMNALVELRSGGKQVGYGIVAPLQRVNRK